MRKSNRSSRDVFKRDEYSVFEFTRFGMTVAGSIILIGVFMRLVFG